MPRVKKSEVWDNYLPAAPDKSVKCKHCDKHYKFANVCKMSNHLLKCFKCPPVIKSKLKSTKNTTHNITNLQVFNVSHQTLHEDNLVEVTPCPYSDGISNEKKHYLDQLLSKAIYVTGAPLSMVEHPLWVRLFEKIEPLYKLPSRKSISTTHLECIYNEMEKDIIEELKSTNNLHLQCDGWNNQRNEGIINFIIAKPEPVLVKSLNMLTNQYTSQYLYQEILKVINAYGPLNFVTIIGDNASNIQRAFEMVKGTHNHIVPLRCVANTLNLLCEDCLKPEPVQAFISIVVQTIKVVKESETISALVAQILKEKISDETLTLPGKSSWVSLCTALKSLQNSKVALQTLAVHDENTITNKVKTNLLSDRFWSMTECCIKLLEPVTETIFKLEANGILINEVYTALKDIKTALAFVLTEITILDNIHKQEIICAVNRRISNCIKPIHCAAYLLDPRTQGVELNEDHEIDAMEYIHTMGETMNIEIIPDLASYRAKEGLWSKPYIWTNIEIMDPVVWWRGLCSSKLLSRIAVRILTAPCTSAATDSAFITHANNRRFERNRLTTDIAAKISFISYNWNVLHNYEEYNDDEVEKPIATPTITTSSPSIIPIFEEQSSSSRGISDRFYAIEFCDVKADDSSGNY